MKVSEVTTIITGASWQDVSDARGREFTWLDFTYISGEVWQMHVVEASDYYSDGRFFVEGLTREGRMVKLGGFSSGPARAASYQLLAGQVV